MHFQEKNLPPLKEFTKFCVNKQGTYMQNNETKRFFSFTKQLETLFIVFLYFFQFVETIKTRWNSDLFRTVSYFAKEKKNTKLSTECWPKWWNTTYVCRMNFWIEQVWILKYEYRRHFVNGGACPGWILILNHFHPCFGRSKKISPP